jgi:hypothetical protein
MSSQSNRSIALVLAEKNSAWVLGKIASRLVQELPKFNLQASIVNNTVGRYDFIVWMFFAHYQSSKNAYSANNFVIVTHIDDYRKLQKLKQIIEDGVVVIFLSADTHQKVCNSLGIKLPKYIIRLGTDLATGEKQRMKVTMCSNIYPDGRKNENWILDIAKRYGPDEIEICLVGRGWDTIILELETHGFNTDFNSIISGAPDSYIRTKSAIEWCDLYIYTGWDEGAMGSIDAFVLKKRLLVSNQGYHRSFQLSNDEVFDSYGEFLSKFDTLKSRFNGEYGSISNWTWQNTASDLNEILENHSGNSSKTPITRVRVTKSNWRLLLKSIEKKLKHLIWLRRK